MGTYSTALSGIPLSGNLSGQTGTMTGAGSLGTGAPTAPKDIWSSLPTGLGASNGAAGGGGVGGASSLYSGSAVTNGMLSAAGNNAAAIPMSLTNSWKKRLKSAGIRADDVQSLMSLGLTPANLFETKPAPGASNASFFSSIMQTMLPNKSNSSSVGGGGGGAPVPMRPESAAVPGMRRTGAHAPLFATNASVNSNGSSSSTASGVSSTFSPASPPRSNIKAQQLSAPSSAYDTGSSNANSMSAGAAAAGGMSSMLIRAPSPLAPAAGRAALTLPSPTLANHA